jgi:hypothetical protein
MVVQDGGSCDGEQRLVGRVGQGSHPLSHARSEDQGFHRRDNPYGLGAAVTSAAPSAVAYKRHFCIGAG